MKVGDIVVSIDKDVVLASGCNYYPHAIVACVEPFVMVSEEGDMLWFRQKRKSFMVIGEASTKLTLQSVQRFCFDLQAGTLPMLMPPLMVLVVEEQEL